MVPIELLSVLDTILCVDVERLLETLIRLIVVRQQVLQLFFLHLLLVRDGLQDSVGVLRRAQVHEHWSVYLTAVHRLALGVTSTDRALLRPPNR